jgi:hypothetical protein
LQEFSRLRRLIAVSAFNGKAGFVDLLGKLEPVAQADPASPIAHTPQAPTAMRRIRILTSAEDVARLTNIHSRTKKSGPNFPTKPLNHSQLPRNYWA